MLRAGVGAVATQANAQVTYGPRALELLASGAGAQEALSRLLAEDPAASTRQVAVVDAHGEVAVHTGEHCIGSAGHVTGEGVSCQANIMVSDRVWPAMLAAFGRASGPLSERLLDALDAAEAAGGDVRGRQSAALLVVAAEGEPWRQSISLRVEDYPEPLGELRRLLRVRNAYGLAAEADELAGAGRHGEAARLYREAAALQPANHELRFWAGLGAAQCGELAAGVAQVRSAIAEHPRWRDLLERIPAEMAPSAKAVLEQLQ
jgi:uncharacterized Ntn-hydrolase superfamily protein